ncbi:MAG: hypothetical protein OXFUSZZB_001659 [Candidatus Fervidibacter sp.]
MVASHILMFIIGLLTRGGVPQYIGMKWSPLIAIPVLLLNSASSAEKTHFEGEATEANEKGRGFIWLP